MQFFLFFRRWFRAHIHVVTACIALAREFSFSALITFRFLLRLLFPIVLRRASFCMIPHRAFLIRNFAAFLSCVALGAPLVSTADGDIYVRRVDVCRWRAG